MLESEVKFQVYKVIVVLASQATIVDTSILKVQLQLLGEVMFTPGRATLGLSISDILGNVKQLNYNIVIK